MRNASIAVLREIGVETGGSNVQFAVNPADGRLVVIEMNPRVSRSSALASKATGFPIAKVAAAPGRRLHARRAGQRHHRRRDAGLVRADHRLRGHQDPALCLREIPRRRADADHRHEVGRRGHGHRPHLPGIPAEGPARPGNRPDRPRRDRARRSRRGRRQERHPRRHVAARRRTACSWWPRRCAWRHARTGPRKLPSTIRGSSTRSPPSIDMEERVRQHGLPNDAANLRQLKAMGFSDARLAQLCRQDRGRGPQGRGTSSASRRSSSASTPARPSSPRPPPTCTRPTRPASPGTRRQRGPGPRTARRWSSSAAVRTASARASSSTIAAAMPPSRWPTPGYEIDHGQLQSRNRLHRLRHLRPALFRTAHRRRRAGNPAHREGQRHAEGRHRAVRRPDPAEAGRGAGEGRHSDPRHLARCHRPCRGPRPVRQAAQEG